MTGYCEKCATRVHTSDHGKRCEGCLIAERDEAVRLLRDVRTYGELPSIVLDGIDLFLARVKP